MTQQGKQSWTIGGCALLYAAHFLYEIINWHHTHKNSLYKERKLGRTVIDTIGTPVSGFFVLLFQYWPCNVSFPVILTQNWYVM